MAERFTARIDRQLSSDAELWSLFDGLGERISHAASELGPLVRSVTWVKASDGSVTVNRPTLAEARAVLDAEDLEYQYSFYSMSSTQNHSIGFSVFLWTDQFRIMVTVNTPSRVATEGVRVVLEKYLLKFEGAPAEPQLAPGTLRVQGAFNLSTPPTSSAQISPSLKWHQRLWARIVGGAVLGIAVTVVGGGILKVLGLV